MGGAATGAGGIIAKLYSNLQYRGAALENSERVSESTVSAILILYKAKYTPHVGSLRKSLRSLATQYIVSRACQPKADKPAQLSALPHRFRLMAGLCLRHGGRARRNGARRWRQSSRVRRGLVGDLDARSPAADRLGAGIRRTENVLGRADRGKPARRRAVDGRRSGYQVHCVGRTTAAVRADMSRKAVLICADGGRRWWRSKSCYAVVVSR